MALRRLLRNLWHALRRRRLAHRLARRGARLYAQGRLPESVAAYQEALELQPDAPPMLINFGLALYQSGRKGEARAAWQRALALTEATRPYLAEQARILLRQFG